MDHRWDEELERRRAANIEHERYGPRIVRDLSVERRDRIAMQRPRRQASPWEIGAAHWDQRDLYTVNARTDEGGYGRGPALHPEEGSLAYRRYVPLDEPKGPSTDDLESFYEKEAWPWLHYREPGWSRPGGLLHRLRHRMFAGRGPKIVPSPARIHEEVTSALAHHRDLDASNIEVVVGGTEVTLKGTVPDKAQKRLAEDVARHCAHVSDVHNRLEVRPEDDEPADAGVVLATPLRAMG